MIRSSTTSTAPSIVLPSAPRTVLRRLEWQVQHSVNTSLSGDYRSAFRGRGMEFDQVVKYQWGDDLRSIDWNVTARLGEPYRKKFVEERELSLILVFEDSPVLQFGSGQRTRRDSLLEAAALLMLVSATNRDRVGLFYSSPETSWFQRPLSGRKAILRLATRLLSQAPPPLDVSPSCALPWRMIRRAAPNGGVLLWFGPFVPTEAPEGWRGLQQRCQTIGVRADDVWDLELPPRTRLSAYDPVAGQLVNIDTASHATRAAHARWSRWRETHFTRLFAAVDHRLIIHNDADPLQALMAYFHQHGRAGRRG